MKMSFCLKEPKLAAKRFVVADAGVVSYTSRAATFYLAYLCFAGCSTVGTGHRRRALDGVCCP